MFNFYFFFFYFISCLSNRKMKYYKKKETLTEKRTEFVQRPSQRDRKGKRWPDATEVKNNNNLLFSQDNDGLLLHRVPWRYTHPCFVFFLFFLCVTLCYCSSFGAIGITTSFGAVGSHDFQLLLPSCSRTGLVWYCSFKAAYTFLSSSF